MRPAHDKGVALINDSFERSKLRSSSLTPTESRRGGIGWFATALYALGVTLSRLSRGRCRLFGYRLVAQPVAASPFVRSRPSETMRVDRVAPDDPITAQFPRPQDVIARRFAEGSICFVARSGERFAGFIWLQLSPYEEDEVRCLYVPTPAKTAAWDYDVYVAPTYRMSRAFLRLWDAANAHLREQGVAWTFSRISMFNPSSLSAHARFGVREAGSSVFLRFGAVQLAVFSTAPFVHASHRDASRPVVRLYAPAPHEDSAPR